MPYPTETKHFSSTYPNAPQIIADPGGYVGFLDAILVTGYGIAALGDIVVTDGVAVASVPSGHSLRKWQVAAHAGAGHAGLNGEHRVIAASGNTYTVEVTGVPNGTYSGGSTRVAPLGFEITHSSGHKRIYRSKDSRRNAVSLFVDDSNTAAGWNIGNNKALAQVRMVCDVVDIGSFTALDTTWWFKSAAVSGTVARPWMLAGDGLGFYTAVDVDGGGQAIASNNFVQINTLASGDQFATVMEGAAPTAGAASDANGLGCAGAALQGMTHGTRRVARGLSQSGSAVNLRYLGLGVGAGATSPPYFWSTSGAAAIVTNLNMEFTGLASVNPADSGVVLSSLIAAHSPTGATWGSDWTARARVPGLLSVPSLDTWDMTPSIQENLVGPIVTCLLKLPAAVGSYARGAGGVIPPGGYYIDILQGWR